MTERLPYTVQPKAENFEIFIQADDYRTLFRMIK